MPPMPALRWDAVPFVKFVHGIQARAETTGRYGNVHEVWVILFDRFRVLPAFVAGHGSRPINMRGWIMGIAGNRLPDAIQFGETAVSFVIGVF